MTEQSIPENNPIDLSQYLIWWTDEADSHRLYELHGRDIPDLPAYIVSEFMNRLGRAGRGRLWVPDNIPVEEIEWHEEKAYSEYADRSGGIVFHRRDHQIVAGLPGHITDLEMNPVLTFFISGS